MTSNSTTEYKIVTDRIVSPDEDIIISITGDLYKDSIEEQNRYATVSDLSVGLIKTGLWNYPTQNGVAIQPEMDGESIALKSSESAAVRWHIRDGGRSLGNSNSLIVALSIIQQTGENGVGPYQVQFAIEPQTSVPAIGYTYLVQQQGLWGGTYICTDATLDTLTLEYPGPDLPGSNEEFTGADISPPSVYNQVEARNDGVWIKNANWSENPTYSNNWQFQTDGSISFPNGTSNNRTGYGEVLQFGQYYSQSIITGPPAGDSNGGAAQRLVVAGQDGKTGTTGEGGDIYLWAGRGGDVGGTGGDVKLDGGNGVGAGEGGTVKMRGGLSPNGNGGFVEIYSGNSNTATAGRLTVGAGGSATGTGGLLEIRAGISYEGNGGDLTLAAGNNVIDTESSGGDVTITAGSSGNTTGGGAITLTTTEAGKITLNGNGGEFLNDSSVPANQIATIGDLPFISVAVPAMSIGQAGDVLGRVAADATHLYFCSGAYDGTSNIWKRTAWSADIWP